MSIGWIEARAWAEFQAQRWFLSDGPPLAVGGVEIGWPMQIDAFDLFLRVAVEAAGITADARGLSLTRTAKRFGIDRALRANAMRTSAGDGAVVGRRSVLFVSEVPTTSMLEPSILVAGQLAREETGAIAADPRALRRWRRAGFDAEPLLLPWREERRIVAAGRRHAARAWREFAARRPRFEFAHKDVTVQVMRGLRRLVRNSAPWLAVELAALNRLLERHEPKSVAVATDQHRIGRLVVSACAGSATRVVVLQHGLPQTPIAFLPLVADEIDVWSDGVRSWFVEHGAPAERVVVTGNPRLDDLGRHERDAKRREVDAAQGLLGTRHLLVPLSPLGMDTNLAVLRITAHALEDDPDLVAIVKLHPGAGDSRPVRRFIAASGVRSRIAVLRHEPLLPLLLWADTTFLFRSTVALESLAAQTPVVVADIGHVSIADDELVALRLPMAGDGRALAGHVSSLAAPTGRLTYLAGRQRASETMSGPLDGNAARRIAARLLHPTT